MEKYHRQSSFAGEHIELLKKHILFSGLDGEQLIRFLEFARPYFIELEEGQSIRLSNEFSNHIGVVFSGQIIIYGIDYSGNKLLHNSVGNTESSGTLFSILDYRSTLVEVEAKVHSLMLMINRSEIYSASEELAVIQHRILVNLIESQRNMFNDLSCHLYCLCQRSIRDKILKFLHFCVESYHCYEFDIPFSRDDLAYYLAVDRASLSRSLSALKAEGIIDYRKNHFKVLTTKYFKYDGEGLGI